MEFHYEIKNEKLRQRIEEKAKEKGITVDKLIWNYINRGLLDDGLNDFAFKRMHSERYLKYVADSLGFE